MTSVSSISTGTSLPLPTRDHPGDDDHRAAAVDESLRLPANLAEDFADHPQELGKAFPSPVDPGVGGVGSPVELGPRVDLLPELAESPIGIEVAQFGRPR
jgi:hypothetical protein